MKIGIIGLGLIGGSMAKALKGKGHLVYGLDTDSDTFKKAKLIKAIDGAIENYAELDMLFISVYPHATVNLLDEIVPKLCQNAIVCDLCGIKRPIIEKMQSLKAKFKEIEFLGLHPMAGKEYSGLKYSSPLLFENASLLAVRVDTSLEAMTKVKDLMLSIGFLGMAVTTASKHDKLISYTSQLAHIVSSSYVQNKMVESVYGFTAGSFRDMTRVARLNPTMWTELLMDNRDMLSDELNDLIEQLKEFKMALDNGDEQLLFDKLSQGNQIKCEIESGKRQKTKECYNGTNC